MITTVDNYRGDKFKFQDKSVYINKNYYLKFSDKSDIKNNINITFKSYKQNTNNLFISDSSDKRDDEIVFSLHNYKDKDKDGNLNYNTIVGNFVGKFTYNDVVIDIKSRFPDIFLTRMLNFANDVFLDDVSVFDAKVDNDNDLDYSKLIIYYMFILKLEKAFLLGLPKAYKSINNHEMKVKGKIDINRFIKYDIPFQGKISSTSREQKEIQEIIDVLYKAITIIEKNEFSTKNISHIKTHLKQYKSAKYVSNETINKAIKSNALQNPIFSPYKKVLEYSKYIIDASNLEENKTSREKTFGFLVNVAELFEIYLFKLLQNNFPDWKVEHEEASEVYKANFFVRNMKPDIVMKQDKKVIVFDAKYKKMLFKGRDNRGAGDLDRNDFFQINTYMSYYDKQGYDVIAGGLLYPIEATFIEGESHSAHWFGNANTKFIIDGIDLSYIDKSIEEQMTEEEKLEIRRNNILLAENKLIERIQKLSETAE